MCLDDEYSKLVLLTSSDTLPTHFLMGRVSLHQIKYGIIFNLINPTVKCLGINGISRIL